MSHAHALPGSARTHHAAGLAPMVLAILFAVLALGANSTRAGAQSPTPTRSTPSKDSLTKYIGTWNGSYSSDHAPSAEMRIVVEQDKSGKIAIATLALSMQGQLEKVPTSATTATAEELTWQADMMGMACSGTAIIKEGNLHGTLICGHGSINFALKR